MWIPRITLGTLGLIFALSLFGKLPGELVVLSILAGAIVLGIHGWVTSADAHDPSLDSEDGLPPPATLFAKHESVLGARRASRIPADLPPTSFAEMHLRPRGDLGAYQAAYELMMRGIGAKLIATEITTDALGRGRRSSTEIQHIEYSNAILLPHMNQIRSYADFSQYVPERTSDDYRTHWTYRLYVWKTDLADAFDVLRERGMRLNVGMHPDQDWWVEDK